MIYPYIFFLNLLFSHKQIEKVRKLYLINFFFSLKKYLYKDLVESIRVSENERGDNFLIKDYKFKKKKYKIN